MEKAKVYFTKEITPEAVIKMYKILGKELPGNVACKLHSGEKGNQNFLKPGFWKPVVDEVKGTMVECNTAYGGARNSTEKHKELLEYHQWPRYMNVDLMDEEGPDYEVEVKNGHHLKTNLLGKNIVNYDSMLVLAHFKGHPMGGYGGALKQLSIGCASCVGKSLIHSAGKEPDQFKVWDNPVVQDEFCECMADAASTVVDMFKGNMVFINVMANMSVDCDCCEVAEDPCMADIGILASLDPVAIDKACMDLVDASDDPGRDHFLERVDSRHGRRTITAAEELGIGTTDYELICID